MKQKEKTSASATGSNPNNGPALGDSPRRPYPRRSQNFSTGGRTQQNFKASCDVNIIVAHYAQTGLDPYADRIGKQTFGFATSRDFSEAMRATAEVQSAFAAQSSETRSEFANDPAAWLDHITALADPSAEIEPPETPPDASEPPTPTPDTPEKPSVDS